MGDPHLNQSALEECLQTLNYLFIDIARLTYEQGYEEIVGGYCELKVATLDSGIPAARLVAAKKLRLGVRATEPKRLAFRLARELKVWAGLQHPHVLPLLGFYLDDNYKSAVLISEYMNHGDLKIYIAKMKPSSNERLRLVRDLTDGLTYLHSQHAPIRHGDLKPGNVLVNSDRRALLADFGLSKALDTGPTGFTTGNDARGTVRYSSPEVLLQGTAAASLSNDMWSWGCLVFEALADKIPFADIQPEPQLIIALVQGKSPNDTKDLSAYPQQLGNLLTECWSREPSQRPTAIDCLQVVESTLPILETAGSSSSETTEQARLQNPRSLPPLNSLAPSRTTAGRDSSIPNKFTPHSTQSYSSWNPQQEAHTFPAENSPRNSTPLNQRAGNEARQTEEFGYPLPPWELGHRKKRPRTAPITDAPARPKPIVSNSTLVNDSSPELSPAERSILARQESMQRLKELKYAREARNAPAGVETGLRTVLPSRVFTSGQVIAAQAREETTMMAAAPSASTSATVSASVAPLPGAERTYPARQEAMIQEVSPEAGPGNTEVTLEFAPQAGVPSVQGKNKGRAPAHDDMVEMRLFVPGPRARGSDEEQSDTEVNDVSAAQAFRDMIKEKAEIRQVTGECIATFGDILAQTPRGLYDIDMFPSFLRLRGKTYDYGVLYSSVTRIFLLPKRDEIHVQLVVGLDPPIRQGQTKYPYLVLNFNREEELDIELNIDQETIDSKYEGKLQRMYDDQTYRVVSNVFRGLSGRKMIGLGSFASRDNQPGIKANMRAVTGELYFLEKSLIFVAKQATVIDYADIHQIVFSRSEHSIASARTFDIGVVTKCGPVSKVAFTSINKEEFEPVEDFLKAKKMRTKNEINVLAFTALDDDDSDEDMEGGSGEDVPRKKPNFDDDEYIEAAPKKKKKAALKKEKEEDEEMADVNEEKPKPKPKAKAKVKEEAADADGPPKKKVEKYSPS